MQKNLIRVALALNVLLMASAAFGQNAGLGINATVTSEQPRFYGFGLDFTVSDSSGLNSIGNNYRNDLSFYIEPTWNIGGMYLRNTRWKGLTLAGRLIVTQNLAGTDDSNFSGNTMAGPQGTCGNPTINNGVLDPTSVQYCNPPQAQRRTDLADMWLVLRAPGLATIPKLGIRFNPQIRFVLPTSVQSQYANLAMSIGGFVGFGRALPFWKNRIRLGYSFGFIKNFHTSTGPGLNARDDRAASGFTALGGNNSDGLTGSGLSNFYADPTRTGAGSVSNNFSLQNVFSGGIQFHDKVSFDALYILINGFAYSQTCEPVTVNGVPVNTCQTGDAVAQASGSTLNRPGLRQSQVLWVSLNYTPLDYLTLTLAWVNFAPLQNADSTYRQGVISTNYDAFTSVSLGATLTIEGLMAKYIKRRK